MRRYLAIVLVLLAAIATACDNESPGPSLLPDLPTPGAGTMTGTAVHYEGGAPLSGATVVLAGIVVRTDAQGRFTLNNVPEAGTASITVTAPGYVFRGAPFVLAPNRDVRIDVLQDAAPFSLEYYRQWVRNGANATTFTTTRPWTVNPNFYLRRTMDDGTAVVPDSVIDEIRRVIAASIPDLSGNRIQMGVFEVGDVARPVETGWVNITFSAATSFFGQSTVGGNSGTIHLRYFAGASNPITNPRNCSSAEVATIDHEITHTMGFWHTTQIETDSFSGPGCPGNNRPDFVRYHSAVMYSRPVGNLDPDVDPPGSAQTQSRGPQAVVQCIWGR